MIVEMRIFKTVVGRTEEFVRLYESKGFPIQVPIMGRLVGFYRSEYGEILDVYMLWAFESEAERRERRERLAENKEWQAFRKECAPLIRDEESRLLVPSATSWVR